MSEWFGMRLVGVCAAILTISCGGNDLAMDTPTTTSATTTTSTTTTSTTTTPATTSASTTTSTTTSATIPTTTAVPFGTYAVSRHRDLRIEIAASTTATALPPLPTIPAVLTHDSWIDFVDEVHDLTLQHPDLFFATYAWWSDLHPGLTTAVLGVRNGRREQAVASIGALVDSGLIRLQECHRPDLEPDAPRSAPTHIPGDPLYEQAGDVNIGLTCLGEVWVDKGVWDPDGTDILDELVPGQRGPGELAHGLVIGAEFNPVGIPTMDIPREDWQLEPEILEEGFLIIPFNTIDTGFLVLGDDPLPSDHG